MSCPRLPTIAAALLAAGAWTACSAEEKERIFEGDVRIETAEDARRLAEYTGITGRLTVKRAEIAELALPKLKSIGGKLYVQKNAALRAVRLPALEAVGTRSGDVLVIERNPLLAEVDLGGLRVAAYQIAVRHNAALRRLAIGALTEIGDAGLEVTDNPALQEVSAPALLTCPALTVARCREARRIAAADLRATTVLIAEGNDRLAALDLPALERVSPSPGGAIAAPIVRITGNLSLRSLQGLRSLAGAHPACAVEIRGNPALPTCAAQEMIERVVANGWHGAASVCGNRADGCGGEACAAAGGGPDGGT